MRETRYLCLKSDEDVILTSHTSYILDNAFFNKHTLESKTEKEFKKRRKDLINEEKKLQIISKRIEERKKYNEGTKQKEIKDNYVLRAENKSDPDIPELEESEEQKHSKSYADHYSSISVLKKSFRSRLEDSFEDSFSKEFEGGQLSSTEEEKYNNTNIMTTENPLKNTKEELGVSLFIFLTHS